MHAYGFFFGVGLAFGAAGGFGFSAGLVCDPGRWPGAA
jgi:hypothetical protein